MKNKNIPKVPLQIKIIGLLLKNAMSQSDLAKEIYGKKNVRSGISKKIKEFLELGLIKERAINSKSILYTANLEVLGNFNKQEYEFIKLIIQRFWNPLDNNNPIESLKDLLIQSSIIKEAYRLDKKLFEYNYEKDFVLYEKNKSLFWKDKKFRNEFLDKIKEKEDKLKQKTFPLRTDYLFCCFISPETLFNKIDGNHKRIGNPLSTSLEILKSLKSS